MNVLQVLTITTVAFLAFVTVWITRLEDYIEARNTDRYGETTDRSERGDDPENASERTEGGGE